MRRSRRILKNLFSPPKIKFYFNFRSSPTVPTTNSNSNIKKNRGGLDFSILDESESGVGTSENSISENEEEDDEDEDFYDTVTSPEEFELNDSLSGLTEYFAKSLSLKSPQRENAKKFEEEEEEEEEEFCTPPVTPPPTFVHSDVPCKTDNDLFEVLSKIPLSNLENFPLIRKYITKLNCLNPSERSNWRGIDSPIFSSAKKLRF
ncbi:unnamed protein product [Caenorhabditis angaria]|uniref:Uncharacterized protein n=1 Tax=Caenorhabditis angaria TaxID=860376 RepID=A0A9P1IE96_9PELO|nr:unnamed protein product [Caenorhabditis angaria]